MLDRLPLRRSTIAAAVAADAIAAGVVDVVVTGGDCVAAAGGGVELPPPPLAAAAGCYCDELRLKDQSIRRHLMERLAKLQTTATTPSVMTLSMPPQPTPIKTETTLW